MNAHLADCAFELRRIVQHRACVRVAVLMFLLEFVDVFIAVLEVHFGLFRTLRQAFEHAVGELAVGDEALQLVDARQRDLLYASYIREGGFGSHLSVGDDMRDVRLGEIRSGLRKRSNRRSYLSGSRSVIFRQYATTEPAAEPRPGPTDTSSSSRAARMKSMTMRK